MSTRTRNWILAAAVALAALMLLACIKIGQEPEVTPVPPTVTPVPPTATSIPPTATPVPEAKPEVVSISLCRGLTDDDRPFAETNTFSELDPFALSIQVANMKTQNIVAARWYQQDTAIGLTERDNVVGDTFIGLVLEPQGKWVTGDYKVEVSLDGDLVDSYDFAVIGMAGLPSSAPGKGGGESGTLDSYTNDTLGFSIDYPESWQIDEGDSSVQFTHPQGIATALVSVNAAPKNSSEQEAEMVFERLSQNLPDVQKNTSQAQEDGWHGIVFGYKKDGSDVVGVLFSKVIGARGYTILFLAMQADWDTVVPAFEKMWVSFEVANSQQGGGRIGGADEVLIVGVVRDADTGRGIANAVFVILKKGISVQAFLDSGNDESLIYDSAKSDGEGAFQTNVGVERGTTYAVFAIAKGYDPVIDDMSVPQNAPDPWQVTVGMQKE
ncbi:MAG: hypothetical protein JXA89_12900 [Anaerolineae bacterium]|nr:hypothetical protein [Anaerolineae bacterium]